VKYIGNKSAEQVSDGTRPAFGYSNTMSLKWWQRGVIYQIYPRSFQDSNGDGIGDLPGIASRMEYLQWLGIDAIWISPFYPSPMRDFGYDISDYCAVDPVFGTLQDFDTLMEETHRRNMRLIIDYVPNHTSGDHPWFLESRRSKSDPKRNWYIWHDPLPGGEVPNNWMSAFGGSAWEWDELTGQYYLHSFLKEQPDLNWRNPEVEAAMLDVIRFWLERGVDGFRMDAVQNTYKDAEFRNNPTNPDYRPGVDDPYYSLLRIYSGDRPEVHGMISRIRALLQDPGDEKVIIGEIYNSVEKLMPYYGEGGRGCHFPYNFQLIRLPWRACTIAEAIGRYESLLPAGAWPNWVLGNHDRHRVATRVGPAQARVAAMLLLTLRGTPTMYYGDEIGMQDVLIPPDAVQDPWEKNLPGLGLGRDPERTPLPWDPSPGAGFTTGKPWLPIGEDSAGKNVASEKSRNDSILCLYHNLIDLRRASKALQSGNYGAREAPEDVLCYLREAPDEKLLIALNLSGNPRVCRPVSGRIVLSTHMDREGTVEGALDLRADEGVIMAFKRNLGNP
jgi:alpha-glucosidase